MSPLRNSLFILLIVFLQACNSNDEEQTVATAPPMETVSFDSFRTTFDTISLPYSLPEQQTTHKPMDLGLVKSFFEGRTFKPAFGEEHDVPDLAENTDASRYFYGGRFTGPDFSALIIQKREDTDNYYYLCTFTPSGDFVDGMCIAFSEGDNSDKTERRAAINDDYSIQLMQINTIGGKATEDADTRFFEIGSGGHINSLDNKGNSTADL